MRTGQPLPLTTVQVTGSGRSTLANEEGRFQLLLEAGDYELKFSLIGYSSKWLPVRVTDTLITLEIELPPAVIELTDVVVESRAYDKAQGIIIEAIKRKQEILRKLHDYTFDAYTRMVVWDDSKEDSSQIMLITEAQSTSYWEYPDRYKEVLSARRQSANIKGQFNIVVVGGVLNFNKNRVDLNEWQVVTPTAEDALDYYDYYLIDSTYIDSQKIYRLEIEPRNQVDPLFIGHIQIVDSTFDVVGVDVGFNEAVDIPVVNNLRYRQQFAHFQQEYWMPVEISFTANVSLNLPGVPSRMSFSHIASLYSYQFEVGHPAGTFGEYLLEVLPQADDVDSADWASRQTIPLTEEEFRGYSRLDSLERAPKPLHKRALRGLLTAAMLLTAGDYDLFHFNRVDGSYLGFALDHLEIIPRTELWVATGYGFDSRLWQHQYGFRIRLHRRQKVFVGAEYRKRIVGRHQVGKPWYNPTFEALFFGYDPFNYYREEGASLFAESKLIDHTRLSLTYMHYDQQSVGVNTDYSFFGGDREYRSNPVITAGRLRSVGAEFEYDSRKLWRNKGRDVKLDAAQYTILTLGAEYAPPDFIDNDFEFRKYYASFHRRQRIFNLGVTRLDVYAGSATRYLPPQCYYSVGFNDPFVINTNGFQTLGDNLFYGNRVFMVHATHEFGKRLFRRSGLPLIKKLPFTIGIHGGAFWTEFRNHPSQVGDAKLKFARTPYGEVGFSVGNLTPFIWPLNLALYFTWQVSDYDTNQFTILLGIKP